MVQKFMCGVIKWPHGNFWTLNYTTHMNFWTVNYTTREYLSSQLNHTLTSGSSIRPHGNFWTLNYITWELLEPQLHHMASSEPSITPHVNIWTLNIEDPEVPIWCNSGSRSSSVVQLRFQKLPYGVIESPEFEVPMWCNWGSRRSFLNPQFHHMGTAGPSITPYGNFWTINYTQMIFWTINYTTHELLEPQLHHMGSSGRSNCWFRSSYVV
jgi:hypothetical protein